MNNTLIKIEHLIGFATGFFARHFANIEFIKNLVHFHKWSKWSNPVHVHKDSFLRQNHKCTKCGLVKYRKVKI